MRRDPFAPQLVEVSPEHLSPAELRFEIAVLAGLLADRTSSPEAARVLINVASKLTPGGRA